VETLAFGPFRLDPSQRVLVRPGATIALRPKTLEVLLLLLRHAGEVISKEEILATVWEGTAVTEYVLTTCISELRVALGEPSKVPRYLRTVHRSGYRLVVDDDAGGSSMLADAAESSPTAMVGRDRELAELRAAFQRSRAGRRQVVFVTGEMGIGKTTLAKEFVAACVAPGWRDVLLARGQCVERYGAGEPYMPVLEAIGRLGRGLHGADVVAVMRRHAPTWLAQIPGLLPPEQRAKLRRDTPAQTQESMLRQIADGFEALSEDRLLVLLLEDLHLGDHATLELIAALALREGPTRLMIVGTFRDAEDYPAAAAFHRLKQQLLLHRQCEEIALTPLSLDAVGEYLARRFEGMTMDPELAAAIRRRTEGNPLFVARLVDHLLDAEVMTIDRTARAVLVRDAEMDRRVPDTLRAMIEQRTDELSVEMGAVLETASVAGVRFSSAAVAAALGRDHEDVERACAELARRHGFLDAEPGAEGGPSRLGASYAFSHALYQQVVYERLEVTRRRRVHHALGNALRDAWGERADECAAELGSHFEHGGDPASAIECFDQAAAAAVSRGANREAIGYLDRALALLDRDGDDGAGRERRLDLLMTRGPSVLALFGYASDEVRDDYQQGLDLARALANPFREMSCLLALATCQQTRGNLSGSKALAIELVRSGERMGLPQPLLAQLHNPLSQVLMYQGEVGESLALADAAIAAMRVFPMPPTPPHGRPALWAEPRVMLHCQHGAVSFAAGRIAQATTAIEEALQVAQELQHPFNQASACTFGALYEDTIGRWDRAIAIAQQAIATARAYDFPFWRGIAQIFCGHAMACSGDVAGGLALLGEGIDIWRDTGAKLATCNHLNLLADARLLADDVGGARAALAASEAHAEQTGERVFLAETHRLEAECLRRDGAVDAACGSLQRAIDTAGRQGTKLWELRATLALHRLLGSAESRRRLADICRAFDGEPQTRDVVATFAALGA
jgi:DNA-binding winged helix-turn-helix (wHTH) protein/tetratricopeptide (TPR) repeat protein